nr:hypothetical protein [Tanacetum cinerariifolium]
MKVMMIVMKEVIMILMRLSNLVLEEQDLRLSEEARIQEEEDADELYDEVNINQGRGLQVTQNVEDTHVTLTPVNPDGLQESSSMSKHQFHHQQFQA